MELRISSNLEKRFQELRVIAFQERDLDITKKKAELEEFKIQIFEVRLMGD